MPVDVHVDLFWLLARQEALETSVPGTRNKRGSQSGGQRLDSSMVPDRGLLRWSGEEPNSPRRPTNSEALGQSQPDPAPNDPIWTQLLLAWTHELAQSQTEEANGGPPFPMEPSTSDKGSSDKGWSHDRGGVLSLSVARARRKVETYHRRLVDKASLPTELDFAVQKAESTRSMALLQAGLLIKAQGVPKAVGDFVVFH